MPKPTNEQKIDVVDGPHYLRDIKQFPKLADDVQKVLDDVVLPALRANPVAPYQKGPITPINKGIYAVRVGDSSGGRGKRGGFRLQFHWDRQMGRLTKLSLGMRRDQNSLTSKAVHKLLSQTGDKS